MDTKFLSVIGLMFLIFIAVRKKKSCFKNTSVNSTEYCECSQNFLGPQLPAFKVKEGQYQHI